MCNIIDKVEPGEVEGYKVALKDVENGKLISPSTHIKYKVGKVPLARYSRTRTTLTGWLFPSKGVHFYDKRHRNHTQIFTTLRNANIFKQQTNLYNSTDFKLIILKVKGISAYSATVRVKDQWLKTTLISEILELEEI